jgi:YidC/Oxa1 family membrane protein insertase
MDKNSVIGLILIFVIIMVFSYLNQPSQEELQQQKQRRDSIALVRKQTEAQRLAEAEKNKKKNLQNIDSLSKDSTTNDSVKNVKLYEEYGALWQAADGKEEFVTLENDLIEVKISTKGARPYEVKLKNYDRFEKGGKKVLLFEGKKSRFTLNFFSQNRNITTENFYFKPRGEMKVNASKDKKQSILRLEAGDGRFLDFIYTLEPNSYIVNFDIKMSNMDNLIAQNTTYLDLLWEIDLPQQEKGRDWENQNSTIYFKYLEDEEIDYLSETSDEDNEDLGTRVKWIAFKGHFFSSVLIAKDALSSGKVKQNALNDTSYLKHYVAEMRLPYKSESKYEYNSKFYFGPNDYSTLKAISKEENLELQNLITLGWALFRWVNVFAIIPLFDWLGSFGWSYGLIILIMTVIIKLVLFPLTYKSYLSSAKMRVLKPEVDALNKKFGKDKVMEKQQATMTLYRKTGVNPMGGCLPMLLQFPILIAMFRFFPASIQLRQQAFLWATDLSTYDSILDLPFTIPWYGAHVSLFTLLMAVSIVLTTKMNSADMSGSNQMPGMKTMMYMMPVMMVFWFNSYSSGLSYYYFISNIITFLQMIAIRKFFINEDDILRKLQENKKKPAVKSKFQQRLEDAARLQQQRKK